ncbi:MAG: hypothetical protein E6G28_07340 [Actinobacteria bacterium]|nr:MAG: hypothetical protein E6G28_07340 [Actinomycetota bacterium]
MRALRLAAPVVALASAVFLVIGALGTLGVLPKSAEANPIWITPLVALAVLAPATVGLLIAIRQPRNLTVASYPVDVVLGPGWSLQIGRATWPALYAWPIAVAYVFPDGRLLSRRWRRLAGAAVVSFAGFMTLAMLDPSPFEDHPSVRNPLAGNAVGESLVGTGIWIPFWLGILASLVAGVLALRLRLRRSVGIERLQTLWLAWTAALIPLGLLLCASAWLVFGGLVGDAVFPFLLVMQAAVEPDARLRAPHPPARGRLHRYRARARRRARPRVRLGHGGGDARRRAWVPPAPFARAKRRRPALQPRPFRRLATSPGLRAAGAREPPGARGDRRRARPGSRRSTRGAAVLAPRERALRPSLRRSRPRAAVRRAHPLTESARWRADRRAPA